MRAFIPAAKQTGRLTAFEPAIEPAGHILRYCPDGIYNDGNTMPVMLVYGDKGYTEQSARAALENEGFAALAAEANCNILFMSPVGDTWGEADRALYLSLVSSQVAGSYGGHDGLMDIVNFRTREKLGVKLLGSECLVYLLADGSGADFVAEYMIGDGMKHANPWGSVSDYLPAAVMLCNTTVQPKLSSTCGMPAYVVNGTEAQADAFAESLRGERESTRIVVSAASPVTRGFDPAQVLEAWRRVFFYVRRQDNGSGPELYYISDCAGFTLVDETVEISTEPIRYQLYLPSELDMTSVAAYPVMICLHGGSDSALYHAWTSEWPLIGKANGFACVTVEQHVHRRAAEIVEMLDIVLAKYPALDPGKVYASGFSMGSMKSWGCGLAFTTHFAGIAPMDATGRGDVEEPMTSFDNNPIEFDHIIPTFYVAGEKDQLPVGPNQKMENGEVYYGCNALMNALFRKNGTAPYTYDPNGDSYWGLTGETESTVDGRVTAHTHYVPNPDGTVYAAFCNVQGQHHAQLAVSCNKAWEFLKKFRRAPDGSIVIE